MKKFLILSLILIFASRNILTCFASSSSDSCRQRYRSLQEEREMEQEEYDRRAREFEEEEKKRKEEESEERHKKLEEEQEYIKKQFIWAEQERNDRERDERGGGFCGAM